MNLYDWNNPPLTMKHFAKLLEQRGSRKGIDALVNLQALSNDICTDKTEDPSLVSALETLEAQLGNSDVMSKYSRNQFIETLEDILSDL